MRTMILVSTLILAPALAAQATFISPKEFASTEGPTHNSFPFGYTGGVCRFLQIHDDLRGVNFPAINSLTFRRMGFPTFALAAFYAPYPAHTVTIDMWCSTAATTATTASTTFDQNHGSDKKQVLTNAVVNFPATEFGFVPQDFVYKIALPQPFISVGKASFCWEVHLLARSSPSTAVHYYDHAADTGSNPRLAVAWFGQGCTYGSNTSPMAAEGSSTMNWPANSGTLSVKGTNGPANRAVAFVLGFDNTRFGPIPLPFLLPGSASAPSGPCHLYTDIVLSFGVPTDASGGTTVNLPVPALPGLHGARTFSQLIALDPSANPMGLVLSNGVNHQFVAPGITVPLARLYLAGSLGAAGTATSSYGHIVKFN